MMRGHTKSVWASAFFKDSRRVVTGSQDGTLRMWDVQKGALIGGTFKGHQGGVQAVAVSPDDRRIASGGRDNNIIVWDVESKHMVFGRLVKHTGCVNSVCFSPDGKRLASGSADERVVIWDAETGTILTILEGHHDRVLSVTFSPDGQKLASGSADRSVRVWRTVNAELLLQINAHEHSVESVVWSPDGQQLVSASSSKTIKFWNSSNGDQIGQPCTGHTEPIYSLAIISSDGSFIATSSDDKTVRLWSTNTHQQIGTALHTDLVHCATISPNGELLVSGDCDGKVWLWYIKDIIEQGKVEEARRQSLSPSVTQLRSHSYNGGPAGDHDSTRHHPSETYEVSGNDEEGSLFDILAVDTTVRNASTAVVLPTSQDLLTQEIETDSNNYVLYANRSLVRAQNSEWDPALQDALKSIAIQPSLLGYISKGIALCGNERLWDSMEAFDLAFVYLDHDQITIDVLLLIKAIALFNASRHDEAMQRVQDLANVCLHVDRLPCSVVNSYLHVQRAIIAFEDGRYGEAADRLNDSITGDFPSRRALLEPRLKIFTVLFGWDLDSFWQTVNQRRCEAFLRADRVIEAVESHQYMMRMLDEDAKSRCLEWSTAFTQDCIVRCVAKADDVIAAGNHEMAIELYSAAIELDPLCDPLFAHRSKAYLARNLYAEALADAEKVVSLSPSSYRGFELKHAALHGAQLYDRAIEAFKTMLTKLNRAPDPQIRKLCQQYVSPSEAEDAIRNVIHAQLENAPLRLLNTSTGRLCDREAQISAFMESGEYKEIVSSSMTRAPLQTEPITEAVVKYFSWVMLSHRWESKEPLLHDIQDKNVYTMDPVSATVKLQKFCEVVRDAGYGWAWTDTCCINQNNNVELQRSVNSMFVWYRHSALTIVYLSDVSPSSGALAKSAWNTRGWTVQEFLAPNVLLFYQKDWTPYLNDHSPNHKESIAIMQELEDSTGINTQALVAFRPGMTSAREKLQWASTRVTTLQEDIAYSLFGIFGVHLPVIYGEAKQNALGRLLQEIIARSGDITALDWVGKSSEFNSCLPAEIASYSALPFTLPSLPEAEMQTCVSRLRNVVAKESALKLYARLDSLSAPRFAYSRLQLPCIAFAVTEVKRRRGEDSDRETCFTYDVKADGLQDMLITTGDRLIQFSPARPTWQTFLLIRPWNRHDLELPGFSDDTRSMAESMPESTLDGSLGGHPGEDGSVDTESHSRELRLIIRLGRPFGALLLAKQRGGEYKRIASGYNIMARVKDTNSVDDIMDIRTLEIL